jgi:hypothetical protein
MAMACSPALPPLQEALQPADGLGIGTQRTA